MKPIRTIENFGLIAELYEDGSVDIKQHVGHGWQHHPAVKMWRGHEFALAEYGVFVCQEWKSRGYKDGTEIFFLDAMQSLRLGDFDKSKPSWFGDEDFHLSHRSNLVRKLPDHYQLLWPDCPNNLPYVWPKGER